MTDAEALQILTDRRGTMYDPRVVDTFFGMHEGGMATAPAMPMMPRVAAPPPARHSALQTPLRTGDEQGGEDLQTFFDLGRALGPDPSPGALGETIWTHLKGRLPAATFVLYAYDQADDSIVAVFKAGEEQGPLRTTRIPLGDRLSGWVAATGQMVVNSDARLDLEEPARGGSPLRSALAAPILADGRSVAVLSFYSCDVNAFDESHRRILGAAAAALARTWTTASLSALRMA
jgi:GAF domain-containing protein